MVQRRLHGVGPASRAGLPRSARGAYHLDLKHVVDELCQFCLRGQANDLMKRFGAAAKDEHARNGVDVVLGSEINVFRDIDFADFHALRARSSSR